MLFSKVCTRNIFEVKREKTYHVNSSVKVNFFDALEYCYLSNMKPAIVDSITESALLLKVMKEEKLTSTVWLAGHDVGHTGRFVWITNGKTISYSNWNPSEPNNIEIRTNVFQDFTHVFEKDGALFWDDAQFDHLAHPACEYYKTTKISSSSCDEEL